MKRSRGAAEVAMRSTPSWLFEGSPVASSALVARDPSPTMSVASPTAAIEGKASNLHGTTLLPSAATDDCTFGTFVVDQGKTMVTHDQRDATIGHLFDLLLASHSESEVADVLRIGVEPLRDRMKDLRRRGLLAGPFRDSAGTKWKLRYATAVQARAAARKSGLDPDAGVAVGTSFWIELRQQSKRAVTLASNSVRRWMQR